MQALTTKGLGFTALLPLLVLCLLLLGCNEDESGSAEFARMADGSAPAASMALDRTKFGKRRIAETHDINIETKSDALSERYNRDLAKCHEMQCLVVSSQFNRRGSSNIHLRIDPQELPAYLTFIEEGEGEIVSHSVSADDKTFEYIDTQADIDNQTALRNRLLRLMESHQKAKVSDILEIERELTRVQQQIDAAQGRKRFLQTITDFATVKLAYSAPYEQVQIQYHQLSTSFRKAWQGFIGNLADAIEFIGRTLPWIPVLLVFMWLMVEGLSLVFGKKQPSDKPKRGWRFWKRTQAADKPE